jgi:hypothetical protein
MERVSHDVENVAASNRKPLLRYAPRSDAHRVTVGESE